MSKIFRNALVALFFLQIVCVHAQKVSVSFTNQSLSYALNTISLRYNLKIAFDTQVADKTIVNTAVSKVSVDDMLVAITKGTGLKIQRMGDVYMVLPDAGIAEIKTESEKLPRKTGFYIQGIVKDKNSGEALPFASIYLSKNHLGAAANTNGYFRIDVSSFDTAVFVVNYLGYKPVICTFAPEDKPVVRVILMEPNEIVLNTVLVSYKVEIFDNSGTNAERIKFSPSKMGNIPSLTELDIMAPLQMLPGIKATNENAGGFSIRDSRPDKTLLVYDGFTIYNMHHFFGAFSSINTKAIKDIQVYKSGFDPHFGGSAAGIIEITGKSGNLQKASIDAGVDMLAADIKIEAPIVKNKCSFLLAGRRSFTDVFRTPLYNAMFENVRYDFTSYYKKPPAALTSSTEDPSYYYDDLNAKLTFRTSATSILSLSGFQSSDNLHFQQLDQYPKIKESTVWGTRGSSIRWTGEVTPNWNSDVVIGASKTKFDYSSRDSIRRIHIRPLITVINYIDKSSDINSSLDNASLFWNNTFKVFEKSQLEMGINIQTFQSIYDSKSKTFFNDINTLDTSRIYHKNARLGSVWVQYHYKSEKWIVKPGIRFSKYSVNSKSYPEVRLSALYKASNKVSLRTYAGNYYQFVNKINANRVGDYRSAWIISDGDKTPVVSSRSISSAINYSVTSAINLDVELYYKKMNGLVTSMEEYHYQNSTVKLRTVGWLFDTNVKGIDVLLKQTYGNYQLWTAYSLSKSVSINQENNLEYPSDEDQTHELKFLHLLKVKKFVFSLSTIYGSGGVWDEFILNDNFKLSSDYKKNNAKLPEYFRVDAGVNYSIHMGKAEVKVGCNLFNLFDNKNVIQRFDKLSETPLQDINQGINPLQVNTLNGLGFSSNFFLQIIF